MSVQLKIAMVYMAATLGIIYVLMTMMIRTGLRNDIDLLEQRVIQLEQK